MKYKILLMNVAAFYAVANIAASNQKYSTKEQEQQQTTTCSHVSREKIVKALIFAVGFALGSAYVYRIMTIHFDEQEKRRAKMTETMIKQSVYNQIELDEMNDKFNQEALADKFGEKWDGFWMRHWFVGNKEKYVAKKMEEYLKAKNAIKESESENRGRYFKKISKKNATPNQEATATNDKTAPVEKKA